MPDPVMTHTPSSDQSPVPGSAKTENTRGFAWYVVLALGLALTIRFFVAAPYVVSGASMEPTFDNWDYLITDRVSYRVLSPERGDIVVFCLPNSGECSLWERIKNQEWQAPRTLIKRVVGLPGETVSIQGSEIRISNTEHPDGFVLNESYLAAENIGGPSGIEAQLGPDEYFVLGDNRRVSSDSRVWGVLPKENLIGHVLLRLFPISKLGLFPGNTDYSE